MEMGGGRGGLDVSRLRGLTGVTRLEFVDALESAFPNWVELARLLVRLDRKLNQYGAPTQPIGQVAFTDVERAHEEDWLADLVVQADTANPRNTLPPAHYGFLSKLATAHSAFLPRRAPAQRPPLPDLGDLRVRLDRVKLLTFIRHVHGGHQPGEVGRPGVTLADVLPTNTDALRKRLRRYDGPWASLAEPGRA